MGSLKQVPFGAENEGDLLWGEMACCFYWKGFLATKADGKATGAQGIVLN